MTSTSPFSLRIFVVDGDPDGLRVVDRTNWNGKALVFPRPLFPKIKGRSEFQLTGVYVLIGPRTDGDGDMLYVGEGDPVRPRFESHFSNKDFWTRAVFFVAAEGQLNKAHVQFLESQLVQRARASKRLPLDNANTPTEPTLSEVDRAFVDVFLDHMLGMLPVLGIHAFEQVPDAKPAFVQPALYCRGKGITATGYEATQGFIVRFGSGAVGEEAPSMQTHLRAVYDLRQELKKNGVLRAVGDHFEFSQDYVFSSPSMAADIVLGRSANGRTEWKDSNNVTLKELQERQTVQ